MNQTETLMSLKKNSRPLAENCHRGTGVINIKKLIDKNFGIGVFDRWAMEYDHKWEGFLLATAWYKMDMIMFIVDKYKNESGRTFEECAKEIGKYSIQSDLLGVYKMFMTERDPQKILDLFPLMGSRYHNFLTTTHVENTKGNFICDFRLPSIYRKWNIGVVQGRIEGVLEICFKQLLHYEFTVKNQIESDPDFITSQHHFVYQ